MAISEKKVKKNAKKTILIAFYIKKRTALVLCVQNSAFYRTSKVLERIGL